MTRGAHDGTGDAGLAGAAAWGFARTLRNETPGLSLYLLDLPPELTPREQAAHVVAEAAAAGDDNEIVWTGAGRHVLRLRRGLPPVPAAAGDGVMATAPHPGRLHRLCWEKAAARAPGSGEIAIDVRAAGLNFRDVMTAAAMLPEEALADGFAGAALGLECAGVVTALGAGVGDIAVGDRVFGFAPAALASRVVTRAGMVTAMPPALSFAAAATMPAAFVTAIYALRRLARLMPGESVLIHAASGGVGLAALQIAKRCGAVVIATAGAPEKRTFLRLAGADHVADSRDLGFVGAVREATRGAGVDVVLNSLHGEAMEASLDLIKPFGRFVELGKRGFYEGARLPTRRLRENVSYFAVDIDRLPTEQPALAAALLAELTTALERGDIRPLAHRPLAFAEIGEAFRTMQAAQHIGKLVLTPDGNAGIAVAPSADLALRGDGCYLVTGGIGGFGFAAARFLAEHGAGHLALVGRRGSATPGAASRAAELEALGATASIHAADVSDRAALSRLLGDLRSSGRTIRGVVHAANAACDGMAADLTPAAAAAALAAKLGGAIMLDRLTRDDPLDLFWLFSSATALVGAPGQGAYAAANHALEALARQRRSAGRPALAIAWGPIADAGSLAERPAVREALASRLGVHAVPAAAALAAMPAIAARGQAAVALAELQWGPPLPALPSLAAPFFNDLRTAGGSGAVDRPAHPGLEGLEAPARTAAIESVIAEEVGRILRLDGPALDRQRPLVQLGMDSLMTLELRLAAEQRLRLDLPLLSLSDDASIAALAARLAQL
ncbi:MAG: SDR family NAD(P)-dependent oxidoreductase, partial [Alphaproteobacteria bacterium]|nr:SDR family NAD(P)-dependent oxidoreductase [Alphaproteobacteria bacterium]